ncbi:hypothetical protein [Tomitella biformata]|uniref:hypothetical protein n=1 Tax=Tomitella biformata TaxID=630403 RepID=UPI000467018A|nr:hypothetical protein [Tomitella biformata]
MVDEKHSSQHQLLGTPARRAVAYTAAVAVLAVIISVVFSYLTTDAPGSCATEEVFSCISVNRLILTFGPSGVLALGGIGAFIKTLRTWRVGGPWMVWHASGWVLFVLMIMFVATAGGALIVQP